MPDRLQVQESERELPIQRAADALTEHLRGAGDWSRATSKMAEVALNAAEVVPRSEAEALAEALEGVIAREGWTTGPSTDALADFRSRHPKETP